ncbi:hypothetical protein [Trinickia terrae]|uniref:hypothetical protein n=1 Tax=Trinickia terrae TaxID=2571161 RepID=UPI001F0DC9DF|nr:hypothetical protein [Trinickia terrae]
MHHSSNAAKSKSTRIRALLAVGAVALTAACGTGIAAFAGLLPESKGVALAMTTTPLIDVQVAAPAHVSRQFVSYPGHATFAVEQAARIDCRPAGAGGFFARDASFPQSATPTPSALAPNV